MRRAALTIAVVVWLGSSVAAFGQGATTSLYGQWSFDAKATLQAVKAAGKDTESVESLSGFSITLEFTGDQKLRMIMQTPEGEVEVPPQSGAWKVLEETPGKLTIELAMEEADERAEVRVQFLDENSIRMFVEKDDQLLILRRVREKP